MITIRKACLSDAAALSLFVKKLDAENEYLLYSHGERKNDVSVVERYLQRMEKNKKSVVLLAEALLAKEWAGELSARKMGNRLIVGFICGEVSDLQRRSHVMSINVGVLKNKQGLGLGRKLAVALIEHAKRCDIQRLEATVIANNVMSLNLCKKFGCVIEGVKKGSIRIGGELLDEYVVAKMI
jgi:L-amino acid N-acyltransferase YncA